MQRQLKSNLPLAGIRVVETAMLLAGPFVGTLLAEFGAEVIKIEEPRVGDPLRNMVTTPEGDPLWFASTGRNKKSVTLNLRDPKGQEIFKELLKKSDVWIQAFRPGTLERWGLDHRSLAEEHPELIMLNISGYGQTGPYKDRAGFGRTCQAFGGLTLLTGFPDRPPITTPYPLGDYQAALFGAFGIMLALFHRLNRSGRGQEIDVSLYESVFRVLEFLAPEYDQLGVVRQRNEPWSANTGPTGTWKSRDDKWVAITCTTDNVWRRLAEAMGQPELAHDPRFATQKKRKEHERELSDMLTAWVGQQDGRDVADLLNRHGVPASLCMSIEDIFEDPHYRARESFVSVPHKRFGTLAMANVVPRLSETPGSVDSPGPDLGEHTEEILGGLLGIDASEMARLGEGGVI